MSDIDDDDDHSLPKDEAYYSDEEWTLFDWAVGRIQRRLSMSTGAAEKTLRGLCADGTVRSVRQQYSDIDETWVGPPAIIRPSEWVSDQVDFTITNENFIGVSEGDLRHWLDKQQPEKPKAVGKQPRITRLLAEMWPNGVPDPALAPRKALKADLLKRDPGLKPLDEHTLKSAIEAYNADPKRS